MPFNQNKLIINGEELSSEHIYEALKNDYIISVPKNVEQKVEDSYQLLNKFVRKGKIIYGVNTGLGGFVNWIIPNEKARELQENLIAAVATNVGPYLDDRYVRASMIARINSLAKGASAISLKNFNTLINIYNSGIVPCIPSKGSLGASGDLGPLAAIALVATGNWKAKFKGKLLSGKEALDKAGIQPMILSYKEGLSLINGTSVMAGMASVLIEDVLNLIKIYDVISCLSFEALQAKKKPFNPIVHKKKNHQGQQITSENIWSILQDSTMIVNEDKLAKDLYNYQTSSPQRAEIPIEDAYSIRCTPQILGPIRDSINFIKKTIIDELNSCSDNPLVIPEENDIFHNGHFHGQYLSMVMDHLSIALTTLSNLSDRRIDRFMDKNNSNNLPPFLCAETPGIRLGLMGGQFMSTSLTAENRSLCIPLSIQTLTSTGDFQDIVSFGLIAARRAQEIYSNSSYIIAFELLCAAQAVEIRGIEKLSKITKELFYLVRKEVPYLSTDKCLTEYLENLSKLLINGDLLNSIKKIDGKIIK